MITSYRRIRPLVAALAIASLGLTYSRGQPAPAVPPAPAFSDEPLVITNGTLSHAGKTMPATVRNVVELLRQRYPDANINIVGVENVQIGDLALNWKRHAGRKDDGVPIWREPPLEGVLHALSVAAEGKFMTDHSDGRNVLLRGPIDPRLAASAMGTRTDLFNLSPLLPERRDSAELRKRLREVEIRLAVGEKHNPPDHPHITGLRGEIEIIKGLLAEDPHPDDETIKQLVEQIQEVVRLTLSSQNVDTKSPAFQYHAGTNLLIVTGSETAIETTHKVLAAMRDKH